MFFIYGNLNFVPGGYDPVRIITTFSGQKTLSPWNPFPPFLSPLY
jgi:hypothetical protein